MFAVNSDNNNKFYLSNNPYKNAIAMTVALLILGSAVFAATQKFDLKRCQDLVVKIFSEQLPLRITLVSVVALTLLFLPLGRAYVVNYKMARLKEEFFIKGIVDKKLIAIMRKIAQHNAQVFFANDRKLIEEVNAYLTPTKNENQERGEAKPKADQKKLIDFWTIIMEKIAADPSVDPVKVMDKLSCLMNNGELMQETQSAFNEANKKALLTQLHDKNPYLTRSLRNSIKSALSCLPAGFENIIGALGIGDLLQPSHSPIQASLKSNKLMTLIYIIMTVAGILAVSYGKEGGATITLIVFGVFFALSVIWPSIRPTPEELPAAENWSSKIRSGELNPLRLRTNVVEKIVDVFSRGRHMMLLAPSRSGKTEVMKALTQEIESGRIPSLKGKTVFYISSADLAKSQESAFGGGDALDNLITRMGNNYKNIILIFDEIHALRAYFDRLKPLLDKQGRLHQVIALTTLEEYNDEITNIAFKNRFENFQLPPMSDAEVRAVLSKELNASEEMPLLADGSILQAIIDASKEIRLEKELEPTQPYTAINLLKKCISLTVDPNHKINASKEHSIPQLTEGYNITYDHPEPKKEAEQQKQGSQPSQEDIEKLVMLSRQKAMYHKLAQERLVLILQGQALPPNSKKRQFMEKKAAMILHALRMLKRDLKANETADRKFFIDADVIKKAKELILAEMQAEKKKVQQKAEKELAKKVEAEAERLLIAELAQERVAKKREE